MKVSTAGSAWQRYVPFISVDQSHLCIAIHNVVTLHKGQARGQSTQLLKESSSRAVIELISLNTRSSDAWSQVTHVTFINILHIFYLM